jgi:hypothetical protein
VVLMPLAESLAAAGTRRQHIVVVMLSEHVERPATGHP